MRLTALFRNFLEFQTGRKSARPPKFFFAWPLAVLALALAVACGQPEDSASVIGVHGLLPDLTLQEMVAESDAVVIGTLIEELGTKHEHGGNEARPKFYYEYKDYKFAVEDVLYPAGDFPRNVAVLLETGIVPAREGQSVRADDEVPTYETGDKVLLFLENLKPAKFDGGVARPIPKGYISDNYYLAIVTGSYGKMESVDGVWKDSRSGDTFTKEEVERAIQNK